MKEKRRAILWYRNDLRLHDNESLHHALNDADEVIPVFVFDDKLFVEETSYGFRRTGFFRLRFILEALQDLQDNLREKGSDLYVYKGNSAEVLTELARHTRAIGIYCNRERTPIEVAIQDEVEQGLWKIGQEVSYDRGKMLYYTADLPFPIAHAPDQLQSFKREVERFIQVREPMFTPDKLERASVKMEQTPIPDVDDFGFKQKGDNAQWLGGEKEGLHRLNQFIWEGGIEQYLLDNKSINGAVSTSRLSPYIAMGCISPKKVYFELKKYETEKGKSPETEQFFHELLRRDFFRIMGKKHKTKIFRFSGIQDRRPLDLKDDHKLLQLWRDGKSESTLVNDIMHQLNTEGWIPQTARWAVASYLVHELGVNWLMGAEWFESMLLDYDPCSNYGNWNDLLGIGSEAHEFKPVNIEALIK